jgi:hypothetical protein
MRRVLGNGVLATVAAMVAAGVVAALGSSLGVDFEVEGGESIPVSGIVFQAGVFSLVGVAIALALLLWSTRPAERFVAIALALTAVSLVPPVLWGVGAATVVTLVLLHLVVAAVMVPALTRSLRRAGPRAPGSGPAADLLVAEHHAAGGQPGAR